jgi:hypothetical protein
MTGCSAGPPCSAAGRGMAGSRDRCTAHTSASQPSTCSAPQGMAQRRPCHQSGTPLSALHDIVHMSSLCCWYGKTQQRHFMHLVSRDCAGKPCLLLKRSRCSDGRGAVTAEARHANVHSIASGHERCALHYCSVTADAWIYPGRTGVASEYCEPGWVSDCSAPALGGGDVPDGAVGAAEAMWPMHLHPRTAAVPSMLINREPQHHLPGSRQSTIRAGNALQPLWLSTCVCRSPPHLDAVGNVGG